MPPRDSAEPVPPAIASISGVIAVTRSSRRAAGSSARVGGVEPVDVGEQHQHVGAGHARHLRRQPVVVAVADLVGGHGVVLVDDRHHAEVEQRAEGAARVQVAPAVLAVLERHQHLRGGDAVRREHRLVGLGEADLADRGGGLALLQRQRRRRAGRAPGGRGRSSRRRPGSRPCPARGRSATSAARPSSQSSRSRPVSASTSSAEPILTTMRRAAASRAAERQGRHASGRRLGRAPAARTAAIAARSARSTSGTPLPGGAGQPVHRHARSPPPAPRRPRRPPRRRARRSCSGRAPAACRRGPAP